MVNVQHLQVGDIEGRCCWAGKVIMGVKLHHRKAGLIAPMQRVLICGFGFAAPGLGVMVLDYLYMRVGLRDQLPSLESLAYMSSSSSGST